MAALIRGETADHARTPTKGGETSEYNLMSRLAAKKFAKIITITQLFKLSCSIIPAKNDEEE